MELSENNDIEKQISDLYEKFLSRKPTTSEIDYWKNQISLGKAKLEELTSKIEGSREALLIKLKKEANNPETNFLSVDLDGHTLYINSKDKVAVTNYLKLEYEPGTTNLLKKLLKKGMNVVNVGANIGYFTLLAARQVGPEGKVFAFEPSSQTVELLKKNVDANGYKNVEIKTIAVSNKTGFATLLTGGSSLHNFISNKTFQGYNKIQIPTISLDEFLSDKETVIDFMIIDAEGQEPFVLEGMRKTLQNSDLEIILEFNPFTLEFSDITSNSFLDDIEKLGFLLNIIDENDKTVKPISKVALIKQIVPPQVANLYLTKKNTTVFDLQ